MLQSKLNSTFSMFLDFPKKYWQERYVNVNLKRKDVMIVFLKSEIKLNFSQRERYDQYLTRTYLQLD